MDRYIISLWLFLVPILSQAAENTVESDVQTQYVDIQLDEEIQGLKQQALELTSELSRIEQQLLFPAAARIKAYVSASVDKNFTLEAVRLEIDNQLVATHIYSTPELQALQSGGIQKLYSGNLVTGEHTVQVTVVGRDANGATVNRVHIQKIHKTNVTGVVEIQLDKLHNAGAKISYWEQ